jgi:prepilin-type N-terminal cleavage/methylation domain-containing protein
MMTRPTRERPSRGFTLVELLVVVAIIALLIGILVPSLGAARNHAKDVKTRATLKALGDGLEMFKTDNEPEVRKTGGYPASTRADDPTEDGEQDIFGAQWLVRYLMGKDFRGFVPRKNVPADILDDGTAGYEQKHWYDTPAENYVSAIDRAGPYVLPEGLRLIRPKNLSNKPAAALGCDEKTFEQPIIADAFDRPVLYYAANVKLAERGNAPVAGFGPDDPAGVYTMVDNGLFTGACKGEACTYQPWDFASILGEDGADTDHRYKLSQFGTDTTPDADSLKADADAGRVTFPLYVLNRNIFETSQRKSAVPSRRESFLLITAGRDGIYGNKDDVRNFE